MDSEGYGSGGARAVRYPSILTSNDKPQRHLWRGDSWKHWPSAVIWVSLGDSDSSDEFSTVEKAAPSGCGVSTALML